MTNYKKIAEEALRKAREAKNKKNSNTGKVNKKRLDENVVYLEGISERMHPQLEDELVNSNHSLGKHPIFPEGDESNFEQKIMGERFSEVAKRYKRAYDVNSIDNSDVVSGQMPLVYETMEIEKNYLKDLERLAIEMVREEFDMGDDVVEIHAELTPKINMVGTSKNPTPMAVDMEFKNHDEMVNAKEEVYKRRFINALIQGSAKKCSHMFHMVEDELTDIDPRLPNKYTKLMASADYMYYIIPKMDTKINGGVVRVRFPNKSNPKAIIHAQAMVFPVLIHELVKGVMELISGHGLPKNKKIGEYVINKADFLAAEPWDMRIGPALWDRFTNVIDDDDFKLKHHIYTELVSLPVREFNIKMREIMGGTKEGKKIIKNIVADIKTELSEDDFNEAMENVGGDGIEDQGEGFSIEELFDNMGDVSNESENEDDDGWDIEDLFIQ